jgi:hypothetical protein
MKINVKYRVLKCDTLNELRPFLNKNINEYKKTYGVLCFLYSVLLTKGLNELKEELDESGESLIDQLHGHAK